MHYKLVVTDEMDREAKVNGMDYILVYKILVDRV